MLKLERRHAEATASSAQTHEQVLQEQGTFNEDRQAELKSLLESAQAELASAKHELGSVQREVSSSTAAHAAKLMAVKQHHKQAVTSLQLKKDAAVQVGCCEHDRSIAATWPPSAWFC